MRKFTIYLFTLLCPCAILSQNCFNAGFENGTLTGYDAYTGRINGNGQVSIETPGLNNSQHRVMHISEGFDPIAEFSCELNKMLPVVPEGAGQYTLRLGNSATGSRAERVVLRFTVTPELTFFLLRYAVILNDPDHKPFEQPRFELSILDEDGEIFPCGEYKVRAAAEIPGFETCSGGWRVRPWTTVGFELQSFLGKEIQIEILTTDCSQGGHAGYAYLDINCQPLEIKLEGYCPDNTGATMSVTDGFIDYQWSTGEKTNAIYIDNPLAGTEYQVTVTSATGCTLVLRDTIPTLMENPPPVFDHFSDLSFCRDTNFWFKPVGKNLNEIFSPNFDTSADSFLLNPSSEPYLFIANDQFGCSTDSLQFFINQRPPIIQEFIDSIPCNGGENGRIQLAITTDFPPVRFNWETGELTETITNLKAGSYEVTITDNINCSNTAVFLLTEPEKLSFESLVTPISCYGLADGQVEIQAMGGVLPYVYQVNEEVYNNSNLTQLGSGNYQLKVIDGNGCSEESMITQTEPSPIVLEIFSAPTSCYGHLDGIIELDIEGGNPPYEITWDNPLYNGERFMATMPAGTYFATVTDSYDCAAQQSTIIFQPPFDKDCGTFIPNIFSPNGDGLNDIFSVGGSVRGKTIEEFSIYNRWGELVFRNSQPCPIRDQFCGWNGFIRGKEAPNGTYVYFLSISFPDFVESVIFTGEVQLIR